MIGREVVTGGEEVPVDGATVFSEVVNVDAGELVVALG